MIELLISNLSRRDTLEPDEVEALAHIIKIERSVASDEDIVIEGSRPGHSTLLLEGIAARYRVLVDGKRQITALHVPGDFVDLHAFMLKKMDHSVVALSACRVASATHSDLKFITETRPHLTRMLWLSTVIDGAIHREWIVAMGRRSKKAHLAHLICELFTRLDIVGRVKDQSFHLPLSQGELADALGLSLVHFNKTLQSLRQDDVVRWVGQTITVLDWSRLTELAEFNSDYLNLNREPR